MNKKIIGASSLLAAGLVAGSFFSVAGANAATDTTSTPAATAAAPTFGNPNRTPETAVTGDLATELGNIAVAANAGATVDRVENDSDGETYEVHLTLTDGSHVTVKLDANKAITATETGSAFGPRGRHTPETAVTGDLATELGNLAVAANAGATVDRVENDSDGATYEVHLTLADGSHVTVKFDANKAITATETAPAFGGHNGGRHHGDDQDGDDGAAFVPPTTNG